MSIQLGDTARDVITGFTGVVTGRASYLTGCDQLSIQPTMKDGAFTEGRWFDVNRLEKVGAARVSLSTDVEKGGPVANAAPVK